ncbi:hypothetical protein [Flavobacterium sp.]|uniref:hypothetical protein n=1 Tax=Flavobacterium sp. TaxID=239 RepID=UPI0035B4C498
MSLALLMAAKAASSAASLGLDAGKKLIEVSIPAVKKASQISLQFLQGGLDAVINNNSPSEKIKLNNKLNIIDNGLSIPLSFSENQIKLFHSNMSNDLNTIKGQNEIMFLSNSIQYFIDSHLARTGLDRGISYALQYDISAVRNHLNKTRDLRFPGYLLHQCSSLGETIKELNIFYMSILSNGKVPNYLHDDVKEEMSCRYGAAQRKGDIRSYIPYELQLPFLREFSEEKTKNMSKLNKLFSEIKEFNTTEINDLSHEALFILSEELIANEELEHKVSKKLKDSPGEKIIIESFTEIHTPNK